MESNDKLEQLLKQMYAQESLHDDDIDTSDIIDEEWTKFEAEHFGSEEREVKSERFSLLKIAAIFIGVLMLSGITYAAVQLVSQHVRGDMQSSTQEVRISNSHQQTTHEQPTDSTAMNPVVFEDAELGDILSQITSFYQVEPVYKNKASKHIRLYFTWDKKQSLDDIIDTFNKFERIHITREDKKLIVK